jgi:flagellar FliL protein
MKKPVRIVEEEELEPDEDEADGGGQAQAALPPPVKAGGGKLKLILGVTVVTLLAAGLGGFFGLQITAVVEKAVADRAKAVPAPDHLQSKVIAGDMVLQPLDPIVTNLAHPNDTWIRLETSILFQNGVVKNPAATAAEIRQDILAYARTMDIAQLEGPSALQHLREDLNERVAIRSGGAVNELVIQSLIVQ